LSTSGSRELPPFQSRLGRESVSGSPKRTILIKNDFPQQGHGRLLAQNMPDSKHSLPPALLCAFSGSPFLIRVSHADDLAGNEALVPLPTCHFA